MKKHCPCCNEVELRIAVRRGVEIDYCPDCNGIWLDNGELNKIVAESVHASEVEDRGNSAKISAKTSSKASKNSILKSFFSLMGSTKDDASEAFYTDDSYDTDADDDFISPSER
ncbi:zf-TFIIB domain-containing protein [Desulfobulbus sp. TB]|nr:zf-TFIIB domain-containing protein [Desulfobulbus sp. TB]